jgi:hypothetical protein
MSSSFSAIIVVSQLLVNPLDVCFKVGSATAECPVQIPIDVLPMFARTKQDIDKFTVADECPLKGLQHQFGAEVGRH